MYFDIIFRVVENLIIYIMIFVLFVNRSLCPSYSSSYTYLLKTVSMLFNLQNANPNFNPNTSLFDDMGLDKYYEQLDFKYNDIFASAEQRCRIDLVYFFL
jgi:hypothetical protein